MIPQVYFNNVLKIFGEIYFIQFLFIIFTINFITKKILNKNISINTQINYKKEELLIIENKIIYTNHQLEVFLNQANEEISNTKKNIYISHHKNMENMENNLKKNIDIYLKKSIDELKNKKIVISKEILEVMKDIK
ncbi:hypothetical protein AB836_01555 [Rickettsiales bacterium (ex Bugula neritina AB1)]|nr:hypothetical protein AB836_01555 [Rickettsiales bacterium (ex Bugula neritina AB1)]